MPVVVILGILSMDCLSLWPKELSSQFYKLVLFYESFHYLNFDVIYEC